MTISKVKDLMTPGPILVNPDTTLSEAAAKMKIVDCGALPVGDGGKLKGIITDRDIIIRAIALGKNPAKEVVSDYMTPHVYACQENDTLEDAAEKMRAHKVGRLVVKNSKGKVTGVLSFGGILRKNAAASDVAGVIERATTRLVA